MLMNASVKISGDSDIERTGTAGEDIDPIFVMESVAHAGKSSTTGMGSKHERAKRARARRKVPRMPTQPCRFEVFLTKKYQCHRLVYYESFQDAMVAISREKQLKRWRREKKIGLIEKLNPRWQDLAENWGREMRFSGQSLVETP